MPSKRFPAILLVATGLLVGCDDSPKPRRPPADNAADTTEALRERRRNGSAAADESDRSADERYLETPSREERLRPDFRRGESSAADAAEDQRDADADRPFSARDE